MVGFLKHLSQVLFQTKDFNVTLKNGKCVYYKGHILYIEFISYSSAKFLSAHCLLSLLLWQALMRISFISDQREVVSCVSFEYQLLIWGILSPRKGLIKEKERNIMTLEINMQMLSNLLLLLASKITILGSKFPLTKRKAGKWQDLSVSFSLWIYCPEIIPSNWHK